MPPTQSLSPQHSLGSLHTAPPGTAQQLPDSQLVPLRQVAPLVQHPWPSAPQVGGGPLSRGPESMRPESTLPESSRAASMAGGPESRGVGAGSHAARRTRPRPTGRVRKRMRLRYQRVRRYTPVDEGYDPSVRLVLIRHGESIWNASGRWQGQSDVPLSPRGRLQARALAQRLFELQVDHRFSSDLSRAAETASALGHEAEPDPRFREIDVGEWAGLERREVAERFPDQVEGLRTGAPVRIGGGESMPAFEARVDSAVDALRERHRGERVLLVTHGGVIRALATRILGVRGTARPLGGVTNTSLSVVRDEGELVLEVYNDATHLDSVDRDASVMSHHEPSTRFAIIAADPNAPPERRTTDAILSGLGIPDIYAAGEALGTALAAELTADGIEDATLEAVRVLAAEHDERSFALVLTPDRVVALTSALLDLPERGVLALAEPGHGAVAQLQLTARGATLCSYGVRMASERGFS